MYIYRRKSDPMSTPHQQLIRFLQQKDFKADCGHCGESFPLSKASLFPLDQFPPEAKALLQEMKSALQERKTTLQQRTLKSKQKSQTGSRSVNIGFIMERLAPALPHFPFDKNDCRSLFDPIDYVIFEGLNKTGKVQKIFFVDIKSGEAKLKKNQQAIRRMIEMKKLEFKQY